MFFKVVSPIWHSRMIPRAEFWLMEFPCQSLPPLISFSWAFLFISAIQFQDNFHWLFVMSLQNPSQSLKPKYHLLGLRNISSTEGGSRFPSVAFSCHWVNWTRLSEETPFVPWSTFSTAFKIMVANLWAHLQGNGESSPSRWLTTTS